ARPEGGRDQGVETRREEHDGEAPAERERTAELRPQLLQPQCEGRICRRVDVRGHLRRLHRERPADAEDGRPVRRPPDGLMVLTKMNRRAFVQAAAAAATVPTALFGQAPTVMAPKSVKPILIASSNGHKFQNGA